jgi:retinoid hydroxylase
MDDGAETGPGVRPLAPGSLGPPWIGEMLAFVRNLFGFFARAAQKHGPVFRTRLLGEPVVCLAGPRR